MIAILLFAGVMMMVLVILLARYSAPAVPPVENDDRPEVPAATLRQLTAELMVAMGMHLEKPLGDDRSFVALRSGPLGDTRYLVMLAPDADQATILEAAESLRGEAASRGLLITQGRVDAQGLAGLDVPLEVIDRARFRDLMLRHLPTRLEMLDRYRGFGTPQHELVPHPA
jgi:hypothetical protein